MNMKTNFLRIEHETESEFERIADILMNEYAIQNQDSIYRLIEVEFYWTSTKHKDPSTYNRKHINPKNGNWFFHYSGVDIALRNDKINGYGGILIRSIYSLEERKTYNGPMVCAMKLFSGTDVFTESIKTKVIEKRFDRCSLQKRPRVGLGENAKIGGTDKLNYRFQINPNDTRLADK